MGGISGTSAYTSVKVPPLSMQNLKSLCLVGSPPRAPSAIVRVVLLGERLDDANIFWIPNDHEIRARERWLEPAYPVREHRTGARKSTVSPCFSQWDFE